MIKHEENSQYYMKSQTKGNKKAHPLVNIQAFSILGWTTAARLSLKTHNTEIKMILKRLNTNLGLL